MDILQNAKEILLFSNNLTENDIQKEINIAMSYNIDFIDLYLEKSETENWILDDRIIKTGYYNISQGLGVRTFLGETRGYSYADIININSLKESIKRAKNISSFRKNIKLNYFNNVKKNHCVYISKNPLEEYKQFQKISFLKEIDKYIREKNANIIQVIVQLYSSLKTILVAASDGTFAADMRPMVQLRISVILQINNKIEQGNAGIGGRYSYRVLFNPKNWKKIADEAIRIALINLKSIPLSAGLMPVVLGSGWPGVLLHEAVGHGLEGDFNRKGVSNFSQKMGKLIASPLCTVIDNGTIKDKRGSLNIDDEGTETKKNILIENGKLVGYMLDKHNAFLMKKKSTGNGRRESYAHIPMPRMTNTYMLPGNYELQEMISSIQKGIFAVNFNGGEVDITSGKFVFVMSEAYLIEKGKVTKPLKGATLIGDGPSIMKKISMVGNDLSFDLGIGICGKNGQNIPVGVGQPSLKIDEINIGGTKIK